MAGRGTLGGRGLTHRAPRGNQAADGWSGGPGNRVFRRAAEQQRHWHAQWGPAAAVAAVQSVPGSQRDEGLDAGSPEGVNQPRVERHALLQCETAARRALDTWQEVPAHPHPANASGSCREG